MGAALSRIDSLAALRAQLDQPRLHQALLRHDRRTSGFDLVDTWLDGWPEHGLVEIVGAPGSGRLGLVAPLLSTLTRQGRPVAVVDPEAWFYPPGLDLDHRQVLLVRPPSSRACWVAEQVVRSGALEAVVLLQLPRPGRAGAIRLGRAVDAGKSVVFSISETRDPDLPASLRLELEGGGDGAERVRCTRSRSGHEGEVRRLVRAA